MSKWLNEAEAHLLARLLVLSLSLSLSLSRSLSLASLTEDDEECNAIAAADGGACLKVKGNTIVRDTLTTKSTCMK